MISFVRNSRQHGVQCDYVVADDGTEVEMRGRCRRMLRELQSDYGVSILYAGPEEKRCFVNKLIDSCGLPPDVAHFALFDVERTGISTGANRNALLLATAGEAIFSADDDTLCRPSRVARAREGLGLVLDHDPADFWVFPDRETAMRSVPRLDEWDILADHERFLGRRRHDLLGEHSHGREYDQARPAGDDRLGRADGQVTVTLNGLLGDCGWNSPLSYLLWTGASHDRLVRSEETYRQACTSREILRIVDRPTLSDASFMMSTFMGLDNRRLLPPFMPVMRGQDHIFGLTLWRCLPDAWFMHLPVALVHWPAAVRRFWRGETVRGASGLSLFQIIQECIRSARLDDGDSDGSSRLRALGQHLMTLGHMPSHEFDHALRQWVLSSHHQFTAFVRERLQSRSSAPSFWKSDLETYVRLQSQAVAREDYCVPLDLLPGGSVNEIRQLMHRLVFQFGQLLYWWPFLVEAAKDLRDRGHRLAVSVERADDE